VVRIREEQRWRQPRYDNRKMSYCKRPATAAWIWLVAAVAYCPARAGLKPEEIYSKALPSVLTLEVQNTVGERFVAGAFLGVREGMAVTAWHVIHDAQSVEACFADGRRAKVVGLVDKNEEHDLALVRLETNVRGGLALGSGTPPIGSRVYIVGTPKGFDFSLSEGLISQVRLVDGVRYYQLSSPISPGDSGGPVLNDQGRVVGVVSWRKATAENLGFAIPSSDVALLDPSHPVVPWPRSEVVATPGSAPARDGSVLVRGVAPGPAPPPSGDYGAFQRLLAEHAGKPITVIVREGEAEHRFSFTVPKGAVRQE
jgi:S1-C subfamily serine protease